MGKYTAVILHQTSNLASGLGNSIIVIAIPWLVLEQTNSATFAGVVVAMSALPGLVFAPIGGWFIDWIGAKRVSVAADILSSLSVLALPLIAISAELTNTAILLLAILGAAFDPVGYSARRTLLVDVASTARMNVDKLNGFHDGFGGVAWILGPAVGAWLIAVFGAINSFWVVAVLFLVAAVSLAFLRLVAIEEIAPAEGDKVSDSGGVLVGFQVLWGDKVLRTLTFGILIIAAVYLPTESIVLPKYFQDINSPASLGLVISALSAGTAFGSFGYGWIASKVSSRTIVRSVMVGSAISILPMALFPPLWVLIFFGFCLGLAWGPFMPLMTSLIQRRVSPAQHGRAFGAQSSVFYAAPPLGMVLAGMSVDRFGVSATYLALALILSATALLVLLTRSLRSDF
jgi:MFS family permease